MKADENEQGSNIMWIAEKYIANDQQILYNSVAFCLLFVFAESYLFWNAGGHLGGGGMGALCAPLP